MEQTFGTWSVRGGLRALATAVYERCLARRVEFVFDAAVVRIVEKDGRAAGVELADGTTADADFVVAGVAPTVLSRLTSGVNIRSEGDVPARTGMPSRLTVLLALSGARPEGTPHRTVLHSADRQDELDRLFGERPGLPASPTVTVLRPDDPELTPDGAHEAVTLTVTVPAHLEVSPADVERVISRAEAAIPGLRERLLWHEARTPADIAEATGAEGGAVPAPALAAAGGSLLHPANSTRLPGLFAVGGLVATPAAACPTRACRARWSPD